MELIMKYTSSISLQNREWMSLMRSTECFTHWTVVIWKEAIERKGKGKKIKTYSTKEVGINGPK